MDLTQLRYFQTVAKTGNITKAARELYITQPNLSKSIARLEQELQVPLFDHRKGRVELNDYGRMFLSSVDLAFSQLEQGVDNIRRLYDVDQNILSLASNIQAYLPDVLPTFIRRHPDIGIRQIDCTTQEMVDYLLNRRITLGISYEEIKDDRLVFEKLDQAKYILAVNRDNPLAVKDEISLEELKDQGFICDLTRMGMEHLRKLCQEYGFNPQIKFEVQSSDLLFRLLEGDYGVAIIPVGMACQVLVRHPEHHLKLLRLKEELMPVIIGIAYPKGFHFTKAVFLFVDYLKDSLRQEEALIRDMGYKTETGEEGA